MIPNFRANKKHQTLNEIDDCWRAASHADLHNFALTFPTGCTPRIESPLGFRHTQTVHGWSSIIPLWYIISIEELYNCWFKPRLNQHVSPVFMISQHVSPFQLVMMVICFFCGFQSPGFNEQITIYLGHFLAVELRSQGLWWRVLKTKSMFGPRKTSGVELPSKASYNSNMYIYIYPLYICIYIYML